MFQIIRSQIYDYLTKQNNFGWSIKKPFTGKMLTVVQTKLHFWGFQSQKRILSVFTVDKCLVYYKITKN